jgi:SM-20-related protein
MEVRKTGIQMGNPQTHTVQKIVSGREIYINDSLIPKDTACRVASLVSRLVFRRTETSRSGADVSGSVAEISEEIMTGEAFFDILRNFGEKMFFDERFQIQRVYVNSSVYGDLYYPHRDCAPDQLNVTVLYYANLEWHKDWAGETLFFNDLEEAEVAVWPRPGRVVAFRGGILHRGGVPSRLFFKERLTIAYKLRHMR